MKFSHKDSEIKHITDRIILNEYCADGLNLPIDGAYAQINGPFGPKINKTFTELFFVVAGTLKIEMNNTVHELNSKDLFIVPPNTKHKILGDTCEVFIACTPQFNVNEVEICD